MTTHLRQLVRPALAAALLALASLPAGQAGAAEAVRVVDNAFRPASVTVVVGEPVTWSWTGDNPHSVAGGPWGSSHPGCSPASTVACGGNGATFTWTPQQAGTVSYSCQVHGSMTGTVRVLAQEPSPTPSEEPSASPSTAPSGDPSPTASPSASPSPTADPSPSPSGSASASPRPGPSGSPSPGTSPSPDPTVGPPSPRETEPPVVVEPTGPATERATPRPEVTLEAFPTAPDPDELVASERELEAPAGEPADRTTPLVLALGLVLGTGAALVQFVLLGPPWDPDGNGDDDAVGPRGG